MAQIKKFQKYDLSKSEVSKVKEGLKKGGPQKHKKFASSSVCLDFKID